MTACARALLVDLDGTLADSIGAMVDVYHAFVARHGGAASREEFDRLNGPSLREVVADLARTHGISGDMETLHHEYIADVDRAYASTIRPNEGAGALIETAKDLHMALVLVTANHRGAAEAFLDAHGWRECFSALVTGDDVALGKPDPALYRRALDIAGIDAPLRAIAVEDSANGIASATGAGVPTIALCRDGVRPSEHPLVVACVTNLHEAAKYLREASRV